MASHAPQRMTLAAFLKWQDGTGRRYQLLDGRPIIMTPAREAHRELAARLMIEIGTRLKRPCRVVSEAGIVIPQRSDTCYVADLAVTRVSHDAGHVVTEPSLIVEVNSARQVELDRWRRVADYRTVCSVEQILIVCQDERQVMLQSRAPDGWRVEHLIGQASITLGACESPIPLEALYGDLLTGADEPGTPSGA